MRWLAGGRARLTPDRARARSSGIANAHILVLASPGNPLDGLDEPLMALVASRACETLFTLLK
jgi:hypothetical protein